MCVNSLVDGTFAREPKSILVRIRLKTFCCWLRNLLLLSATSTPARPICCNSTNQPPNQANVDERIAVACSRFVVFGIPAASMLSSRRLRVWVKTAITMSSDLVCTRAKRSSASMSEARAWKSVCAIHYAYYPELPVNINSDGTG